MKSETYGSFPAAIALIERLKKLSNPLVIKKVSRLLQDYNEGLRQIESIPQPRYRKRCALLWRDDHLDRVAIDPFVDKYVRNVLCTYAKAILAKEQ